MKNLRRTSRRHQAVNADLWVDFPVGTRVRTVEGFLGTVTAVEDGPYAGAEQYVVALDGDMGGGNYGPGELQPVEGEQRTASLTKRADEDQCPYDGSDSIMEDGLYTCENGDVWSPDDPAALKYHGDGPERGKIQPHANKTADMAAIIGGEDDETLTHVASEDYPELAEILVDRPPLPHSTRIASLQTQAKLVGTCDGCGEDHEAEYDHEGRFNEGPIYAVTCPKDGMTQYHTADGVREVRDKKTKPLGLSTDAAMIDALPEWAIAQQFQQYPASGSDGITYFRGEINADWYVDCLLYYKGGKLVGVLNHYPMDMGPEKAGNVLLMVLPEYRQQGIGRALWEEAVKRWNVTKSQDTSPDGAAFLNRMSLLREAGILDRVLEPVADKMLKAQEESGYGSYNAETGSMASYDWCRFRHNSHCWYPKTLDEAGTKQAGYAVWVPEDRGVCPRTSWDQQKACPAPSEPGPHSGDPNARYETWQSWEQGGQGRYAHLGMPAMPAATAAPRRVDQSVEDLSKKQAPTDPEADEYRAELAEMVTERRMEKNPYAVTALREGEFGFHLTATWRDVQAKAKTIRSEGHVRIISASVEYLVGEVKGEHNIYQTSLMREPGTKRVAMWECGCAWAAYSWGRSGRWKKYEGRMCSHALALNYEAASRGWAGGEVAEDRVAPDWRNKQRVVVPGDYQRGPIGDWRKGSLEEDFGTARPISTDPTLAERPAYAMVRDMLADGDTPGEVLATLTALGVADAPGLFSQAMAARPFSGLVNGIVTQILDLFDDGTVQTPMGKVPAAQVLYPNYHPFRGLTAAKTAAALPEGYTLQFTPAGNVTNASVAAIFEGKVVGAIQWKPEREVLGSQKVPADNEWGYTLEDELIKRPPQIVDLKVNPEHQRKGLATAMYEEAKRREPNLVHDDIVLPDGEAWMKSLGAAEGGEEIVVEPRGHLWGWRCSKCGETEVGTGRSGKGCADKATAREYGENHAMVCWDLGWGDPVTVREASVRTAAADRDGYMIAIEVPEAVKAALHALCTELYGEDAEDPDNYHVTVCYPGDKADVDEIEFADAARMWAHRWGPMTGRISGFGVFHQEGGDKVLYASVNIPGLERARDDLVDILSAKGIALPDAYGFTPHLTLGYFGEANTPQPPEQMDDPVLAEEFPIDTITLARGPQWEQIPLTVPVGAEPEPLGAPETAASSDALSYDAPLDAAVASVVDDALDTISFAADLGLVDEDAVRWYSSSDAGQAAAQADMVGWGGETHTAEYGPMEGRHTVADLHEEPEAALPTTTGEDDEDDAAMARARMAAFYTEDDLRAEAEAYAAERGMSVAECIAESKIEQEAQMDALLAQGSIEAAGSVQDIVAAFQQTAGAQFGNGGGGSRPQGGEDMQIAAAARAFLAGDEGLQKSALKDFSPAEQKQIIDEGAEAGVVAANLASLDITGTHYESLEAAFREAEAELPDEEWLY